MTENDLPMVAQIAAGILSNGHHGFIKLYNNDGTPADSALQYDTFPQRDGDGNCIEGKTFQRAKIAIVAVQVLAELRREMADEWGVKFIETKIQSQ